ncbi:MAG: choice-of-anchor Q domain-containing protein, partial [Vicinamibacterales bacterium]
NGGPTMTHAIGTDSPAFDAIACSVVAGVFDQRGVSRPQGAGCDIGAFELEVAPGDVTAPVTTVAVAPVPNSAGWVTEPATVALTATDDGQLQQVCYDATGSTTMSECVDGASAVVSLADEGETNLAYYAVDAAGNTEAARQTTIGVDLTDPTVEAGFSPGPNEAGWNRAGTILSLSASDGAPGSGVDQTCFQATGAHEIPETCVDGSVVERAFVENGVTTVTWWAVDVAGRESEPESHDVKIDRDNPVVTSGPTPSIDVGSRGKYSDVVPVRITWVSTDADGSGVDMHALQYTTDGGASWRGVATDPDPTVTTVMTNLFPGLTYQFRAAARDASGRWGAYTAGPAFQVTLVEGDPSADVVYSGSWGDLRLWGSYGGMTRWSVELDATVTYSFTGKEVAWVSSYGRSRGIAEVYL